MAERCDIAVVGGGIVGLAVARDLARRDASRKVRVLEREERVGSAQTGHNSGVIHAGVYYEPGSLKAELCVRGAALLYELCEARGVPFHRCGKLIVATGREELPRLDELERRARENGAGPVARLGGGEIHEFEPHVRGVAALHVESTGVVDFRAVAEALAEDLREAGGEVTTGCEVRSLTPAGRRLRIEHGGGTVEAGFAVCCAGAAADRLASAAGAEPEPRIVRFRGAYLRLAPERRHLVGSLVYPVPDPSLPFLGVHLTRHVDGEVTIGPTALPIGPLSTLLGWSGGRRMLRRHWRAGALELRHASSRRAVVAAAARYVPELRVADVGPGFAGVRAQALAADGGLVDDFVFSATERALHVRNAPSPGATSSLAIAARVADEAEAAA